MCCGCLIILTIFLQNLYIAFQSNCTKRQQTKPDRKPGTIDICFVFEHVRVLVTWKRKFQCREILCGAKDHQIHRRGSNNVWWASEQRPIKIINVFKFNLAVLLTKQTIVLTSAISFNLWVGSKMLWTKAARSTLSFSCFVIKGCDRSCSRNRGNTIRTDYKEKHWNFNKEKQQNWTWSADGLASASFWRQASMKEQNSGENSCFDGVGDGSSKIFQFP